MEGNPIVPLWISPLYEKDFHQESLPYRTVKKLVTKSPNPSCVEGEVETCLEEYTGKSGDVLWRRVAVRGCVGPDRVLHASFKLPDDEHGSLFARDNDANSAEDQIMCWASFPERPGHKLLCVLANPLRLCIWDVYPLSADDKTSESIGGGEGNCLTLPFEARGIFALSDDNGLLLQRRQTLEDRLIDDGKRSAWVARGELEDEYDDGGFVLQDPPTPVRLGTMLQSPSGMEMTIPQPSPQASAATFVAPVPALFTLKHPLDEILPVTMLERNGSPSSAPPDILEQILFAGALCWTDNDGDSCSATENTQQICVTYHSQRKRHAVWLIHSAPPPPPAPPLWQVSRTQREENGLVNDIGAIHEMPMAGGGGTDTDMSWHGTMNRNEALADALGVTSTRRPEDPAITSRGRVVGERSRRSGGLKKPTTSMFSPMATNAKDTTMHSVLSNESKKSSQLPVDMSGTPSDGKMATIAESPFADLSPDFALTPLYEEEPNSSDSAATNIFLASNTDSSGTLVLCMVCTGKDGLLNPSELRRFEFEATSLPQNTSASIPENPLPTFSVTSMAPVYCQSAQPIHLIPVPLRFVPRVHRRVGSDEALATDVLVLTRNEKDGYYRLVLQRSDIILAECALPNSLSEPDGRTAAVITGMKNPVGGCVDYLCSDFEGATSCVRGRLSLRFPSSPLSNAALEASDAALFLASEEEQKRERIEIALKIRVDSVRLAQAMSSEPHTSGLLYDEDISWNAVECVFSSFVESFLSLRTSVVTRGLFASQEPSADGDWLALLNSDFDKAYKSETGSSLFLGLGESDDYRASMDRTVAVFDVLARNIQPFWLSTNISSLSSTTHSPQAFPVFDSLHLLYEESKLSLNRAWRSKIGSLLARICFRSVLPSLGNIQSSNIMQDFLDHYRRDLGSKWLEDIENASKLSFERMPLSGHGGSRDVRPVLTSFSSPPSFLDWVDSMMKASAQGIGFPLQSFYHECQSENIPYIFCKTRALHRVFSAMYGISAGGQSINDDTVVQILIDEGMNDADALRNEIPAGLAVPLMEVLYRCRGNPQICANASWSTDAWSLIGRTDMIRQHEQHVAQTSPASVTESLPAHGKQYQDLLADDDKDGILPLEVTSSALFPDNRVHEVGKLLRSSRPMYLQVPRAPEVSDHDYERLKQERLRILCRRSFAVPLGRGMLTLGNLRPIPADPLPVPLLCQAGRVPPTNTSLALDTSSAQPDVNVWPEFHNAVAAGLRLPYNEQASEEALRQMTRSWIVYNGSSNQSSNPQNQPNLDPNESESHVSHAQGGLLMALGFRGHLSTLKMTDIYDYLTDGVVTTTVGVLVGMAANKRGSCDPAVSKMLCLHIPSLLPASFTGIDVASPAQAAAVTGIGLLYQGSSNRMMTEFLLEEMGKRPTNDSIMPDREAYTLSCGLALGMVNLAKGKDSSGVFDGVGWNGLADLDIGERLHRLIVGGIDHPEQQKRRKEASERFSNLPSTETERCYSIFEGDTVNTDVTAPGATLALGLMYMKSGNHAVASSMALPDTHFLLDYIRPDLLLLRVVARSLILWDEVEPTSEWIQDQIPIVIRKTYRKMRSVVEGASDFANMSSRGNTSTGMDGEGASDPMEGVSSTGDRNALDDETVDKQAVRQIYVHVIAGACFGIGLRFAGTGDERAAAVVAERLAELKVLREGNDPVSVALRPDLQILEMCIGCTATSLAMIMAGTGDLETFRLLRTIRWRCDDDIRYGSHMAYGAAMGLLFLGGGSYTLGRSPEDLAALVMAFFPRLPSTSTDNKHHLQALRHCYALAVEKREIRAVDSETGTKIVSVPVEVDFAEDTIPSKKFTSPCLLLNSNGTPQTLRVSSDLYYPLTIDISKQSSRHVGTTFFVERRGGQLSTDPHSQHSLIVQTSAGNDSIRKMAEAFTEDPTILAYSQYLCDDGPSKKRLSWVPDFCAGVLQECLVNNTEEALPLYLKLRCSVEAMKQDCTASAIDAVWDIRLIQSYYQARAKSSVHSSSRLISAEFESMLNELVGQALATSPLDESDVLVYMKSGDVRQASASSLDLLGSFLTFYEVPFPRRSDDTMEL